MKTILLNQGSAEEKRNELLAYFQHTFSLYEKLFEVMQKDEAYYQVADPLRHPLIFYYGHTATFFINKMLISKIITDRVHPEFESMFAIGVDEMSWDDLNKTHYNWPSVQDVKDYRSRVRDIVTEQIKKMKLDVPIRWQDPAWIILMGIEHERIHLETSSVLIRQLPLEFVKSHPDWKICTKVGDAPANQLEKVSGAEVNLGKTFEADTYGWDNEYGAKKYKITDFSVSQFLVSNQEFLEFIEDQGYQTSTWWTEEGWKWRQYLNATHPRFWRKKDEGYFLRLMTEEIPMPWNWPVEVNYLESKAFCNWKAAKLKKNIRLPTEAEWHLLHDQSVSEKYPHWKNAPGNIDLNHYMSPCPVDHFQHGKFFDVIGNVWQWTETPIHSFAGFKVHDIYDDFSVPTFDGKHNIIKGGSWISTGNEVLKESRYAFRRHFYQHAGFRYVESEQSIKADNNYYESDKLMSEYLEFHFGKPYFDVANFPKKIAEIALNACQHLPKLTKALDIGCAVGRASFELSKKFDEVYGVDFSARFIDAAVRLQSQGIINYSIATEGELCDYHNATLENMNVTEEMAKKIQFLQGDACNLHRHLTQFDLIIAANLIDRLYDPEIFLQHIHERLNSQGILVITSPYTWLEDYTKKSKWLGGFKQNGESVSTLTGIEKILSPRFTMMGEPQDVPFVIRETQRKFQHTVAQVSVWRLIK